MKIEGRQLYEHCYQ